MFVEAGAIVAIIVGVASLARHVWDVRRNVLQDRQDKIRRLEEEKTLRLRYATVIQDMSPRRKTFENIEYDDPPALAKIDSSNSLATLGEKTDRVARYRYVPVHVRANLFLKACCQAIGPERVAELLKITVFELGGLFMRIEFWTRNNRIVNLLDQGPLASSVSPDHNRVLRGWLAGVIDLDSASEFVALLDRSGNASHEIASDADKVMVSLRNLLNSRLKEADIQQELVHQMDRLRECFLSDDPKTWGGAVDEIVEYTNTRLTSDQMDLFVVRHMLSFAMKEAFQTTRAKPNHLTVASKIIGKYVAGRTSQMDRPQNDPIRILEGGPGFLSTTYYTLEEIVAAHAGKQGKPHVEYIGFDLCNEFTRIGNAYFEKDPGNRQILLDRLNVDLPDVRDQQGEAWVTGVRRHGRNAEMESLLRRCDVRKLRADSIAEDDFIFQCSMQAGVRALVQDDKLHGKFDAFLCSYAFHHVANSRQVMNLILGNAKTLARERSEILRDLKKFIVKQKPYKLRYEIDSLRSEAKVAISYIPETLTDYEIKSFLALIDKALGQDEPLKLADLSPNEAAGLSLLRDDQFGLLINIHRLLREGGVVAIADPDGKSEYNRKVLFGGPKPKEDDPPGTPTRDPEAACAYFLTATQLADLLRDAGFRIDFLGTQTATRDTPNADMEFGLLPWIGADAPVEGQARETPFYRDSNRGYIIIASKESVSQVAP